MFKNKVSMPVVASSGGGGGYQIKKLTVTENGVYDSEFEAYKPVVVDITPVSTLKTLLDATQSTYYLFNNYKGTSVDDLISYSDTANVTNMSYMFNHCANLTTIPQLDTSKVTNMSYMFQSSQKLTSIPQLDTSKVTNMYQMFSNCNNLTSIPQLDTSNVTNMQYMFSYCYSLISIPQLNVSKVTNFGYMFSDCSKLTSIGMYGFTRSIDISQTALEHDAIVAFLNQAGTAYNSSQKITLGSTKLALLSDDEKAIATNKGWTLA